MSERLRRTLVERATARGPLAFSEFMEAALYDPDDGFFTRAPVGRDFATSPQISPVFATLLAEQLRECWRALDSPSPLTIVEIGAGDGALARGLVSSLTKSTSVRYIAVERDPVARARLAGEGFDARADIADVEPFTGCIIANELFDNVPFDVFRARDGSVFEMRVGAVDGRLIPVDVPAPGARAGTRSPQAAAIVGQIARALQRGYAFVIDYGYTGDEHPEPVRGYSEHRLVDDLFADPGATDVTGPVDFDALGAAARAHGLDVRGPVTQRDALMSLGYRAAADAMREAQVRSEAASDHRAALAMYSARNEAAMLVDPAGLGSLKVVSFATANLPVPVATNA